MLVLAGMRSASAIIAIGFGRFSLLPPPPKNIAICATLVMIPASAAATEDVRMSRL